ncbi:MAG: serine hydroxymethyltransferase, partial [Desulfurococcaceae archaeon]
GLIIGKQWRNPLEEGADLITSSTHKTFPGPQGGLIATRSEEDYKTIGRIVFPMFVSNHHLHRLAGVAVTGLEMKYWGVEYARQIIRNAKTLAESLAEQGFKVVAENRGFTESHQVVLDVRKQGGGSRVAELFEKANIIVNKNLLPWDKPEDIKNPSGIRIGVQEVTRWGMKESDMKQIAEFMRMVAIDNKDPEDVKKKVIDFRKDFNKVHYGFDIDSEDELKLLKIMLHGGE